MATHKFPPEYIMGCTDKVYEVLRDERPHSDWTQIGLSIQQAVQAAANYVQRVENDDERIDCLYKIFREMCMMEMCNIQNNHIRVLHKPEWNRVLYCSECGSSDVLEKIWQHANTGDYDGASCNDGEYYCNGCHSHVNALKTLPELWEDFGDIPVDEDDCLEESFLEFEAGDSKYAVWRWFAARCPNGLKDLGLDVPSDVLKNL